MKIRMLFFALVVSLACAAIAHSYPIGDLNEDNQVNITDLQIFADHWLDPNCTASNCEANINGAGIVNISDFTLLADNWLLDNRKITLVINELMARNNSASGIRDEWGDSDDWIEIYNYGDEAINIGGMWMTDDLDAGPRWQIPNTNPALTTIAAGGYLLVWADNEITEGLLHVRFALDGGGEDVGLYDADENLIDSIEFGSQQQNKSYGRLPDANDNWQVFDSPTPRRPNRGEPIAVIINEIMYHPYHLWDETNKLYEPENRGLEYIELYNRGSASVRLAGWQFTEGVDFVFPDVTMNVGSYLVVAADVNAFKAKYPSVINVVGGWNGRLANSGEDIQLADDAGVMIDYVDYADQGDWSVRVLGPLDIGYRGWEWASGHDGKGKSLELVNPAMPNEYGQNWKTSDVNDGTPGAVNTVISGQIAPLIVDVEHFPIIAGPNDSVTVTARLIDENATGVAATLHYRVDRSVYSKNIYPHYDPNDYNDVPMLDDGAHGDGQAGDGIYGAQIPAHLHNTIIEFFVEAYDSGNNTRTWPAPSLINGTPEKVTNLLYQVDQNFNSDEVWAPGSQPIYYIIMTNAEKDRLRDIVANSTLEGPNCQMNATFISVDGVAMSVRYNVGVRDRGHGTRRQFPNNYRVNLVHDRPWKDVTAIILNKEYPYLQLAANTLFQKAGLAQCNATAIQVRVNGQNFAESGARMYRSYVHLEVVDSDFIANHYPDDDAGNTYQCMRVTHQADLHYEGANPAPYRNNYFKETNTADDDWSDLIELCDVLSDEPDATYVQEVNRVINTEQWLHHIAVNVLLNNRETTLANGNGDDYFIYSGTIDRRFVLIQHDLDSIFGMGQNTGNYNDPILDVTKIPSMKRFVEHPQFMPRYYFHLRDLIATTFSPEQINPLLDELLGSWVPSGAIDDIKDFIARRNTYVLSLIPSKLTIDANLPDVYGYHQTASSTVALYGQADAVTTRSLRVNNRLTTWSPRNATWSISGVTLNPGINRVIVQTFDGPNGTGNEIEHGYIDIWYDDGGDVDISGTLAINRTLDAASGPWHITGDIVVPSGRTLTIQAGTTLFFDVGTGITVQQGGRLVAEGTQYNRIRLTSVPGGAHWDGVKFDHTLEDNRLAYVDHEFGDGQGKSTDVQYSKVTIDDMTWSGTNTEVLNIDHPSVICRDSIFPSIGSTEPLHGVGLTGNEYLIFEGCIFGSATGYNDIIDFTGGRRPGPIFQLYNNIFMGGGDDGSDLDSTDAHIEGNIFMNFHHQAGSDGYSSAVATGNEGFSSEIYVARNIFINNDHGVLLKEDCYMYAQNNVFVDTNIAVVTFGEPYRNPPRTPGKGAYMEGNIFWNNAAMFEHFFQEPLPTYGPTGDVNVCNSILPAQWHYLGVGNIDADPIFVDPNGDFHLKSVSPAIGTGPTGLDMGAYIPAGACVSGEPPAITHRTTATLTVGGPGITHYKYSVNSPTGPWSTELPISAPIELSGLINGQSYTVYVIGKNSAGVWQSESSPNASKTWTVNTSYWKLSINEILARNDFAVEHEGTYPDMIELYYDGPAPLPLTGFGLTNNPLEPKKFTFTGGTINPGQYMVIYADANTGTSGIHTGFTLDADGDALYLSNPAGIELDSVRFGLQLPDFSIGRIGWEGNWRLNVPTIGQGNIAQPLGNPAQLKINEWLANGLVLFEDDFIELYNPHPAPVDLTDMYLTDNPITQPLKCPLGPLSFVAGSGYAVFIADDSNSPGHLEFRLSADGEMIGLFSSNGKEIDKVIYGPQTTDVSYGRAPDGSSNLEFFVLPTPGVSNPGKTTTTTTITLMAENANKRVLVPTAAISDNWRGGGSFDDSGWNDGTYIAGKTGGVGYDVTQTTYDPYITRDVEAQMYTTTKRDTCYIRILFTVDVNDINDITEMTLKVRYDDGFLAYINGTPLSTATRNFTGTPLWSSAANTTHTDSEAVNFEYISVSDYKGTLHKGSNILAIHALNNSGNRSDFLISVELEAAITEVNDTFPYKNALALLDGLRITELMYHDNQGSTFDYLELYNIGDKPLDLNGVRLSEGIDLTFPQMTLVPGQYIVVVSDLNSFRLRYGFGPTVAGEYSGNLSNGGEDIVLQLPAPLDAAILRLEYKDSWYPTTDGGGQSLTIIDTAAHPATWSEKESWLPASPSPGGP